MNVILSILGVGLLFNAWYNGRDFTKDEIDELVKVPRMDGDGRRIPGEVRRKELEEMGRLGWMGVRYGGFFDVCICWPFFLLVPLLIYLSLFVGLLETSLA